MPVLTVPPRQYPPNNAYDALKIIANEFFIQRKSERLREAISKVQNKNYSLTPEEHARLVQYLEPYLQEYAYFLDQPSKVVLEYDPRFLLPELAQFRSMARLEAYFIHHDLTNGRDLAAMQRLDRVLKLAHHIRHEGSVIHYLSGSAMTNIAMEPLRVSPDLLDNPQALEQLLRTAQQMERRRAPAWKALETERLFYRALLLGLRDGRWTLREILGTEPAQHRFADLSFLSREALSGWYYERFVMPRKIPNALQECEQIMEFSIAEFKKPYHERAKAFPQPKEYLNQMALHDLFPDSLSDREAREIALIRLWGVLSAIRLHKLRSGQYPKRLEELGLGELMIDPFSGKPFLYKVDPKKGFLLYSVGLNGVDDGGAFSHNEFASDGDMVPISQKPSQNRKGASGQSSSLMPPKWLR